MEAAGAIPAVIKRLGSGEDKVATNAAKLLTNLAGDNLSRHQSICSAGGIAALMACLQPDRSAAVQEHAAEASGVLAQASDERCQAVAVAVGAAACVAVLFRPHISLHPRISISAAVVLA